jgi:hypothetical protein
MSQLTFINIAIVFLIVIGATALYLSGDRPIPFTEDTKDSKITGNVLRDDENPASPSRGSPSNANLKRTTTLNSGGGAGGSSGSSIEGTCILEQISYSLRNFERISNCIEFSSGFCISEEVICSVEVYHIDKDSTGGIFEIDYHMYNSNSGELVDSKVLDKYVAFNNFEVFSADFEITNHEGILWSPECTPIMLQVPQKEVCL